MEKTLVLNLQQVLEKEAEKVSKDEQFMKYFEYTQNLKERGLLVKQKYSIAPLDTIGRKYYNSIVEQPHVSNSHDNKQKQPKTNPLQNHLL